MLADTPAYEHRKELTCQSLQTPTGPNPYTTLATGTELEVDMLHIDAASETRDSCRILGRVGTWEGRSEPKPGLWFVMGEVDVFTGESNKQQW